MSRKPTPKRPTVKPKRRAQSKRKQPHLLDRMVAAVPVSEATLHRIIAWSITGIAVASLIGVAVLIAIIGHDLLHSVQRMLTYLLIGVFGLLTNVVWTNAGPCGVEGFESTRARLQACPSSTFAVPLR